MNSPETGGRPFATPVTEYFGRLAATYGAGAYYKVRRVAVMRAIADEITRIHSILDLGCGNGAYTAEFAGVPEDRRLFGADLSFEMLSEARRRLGGKCRFVRTDAANLPFKAASFGLIFGSHVFPFVADLDAAVGEAARCLRPGGVLIATRHGEGGVRRELARLIGAARWEEISAAIFRRAARASRFAEGERDDTRYRAAFAAAGLDFEERAAPFTVGWDDVAEWIRIRWMPVIPESERGAAERMIAEAGAAAAGRTFALHEPIALGRKPA
ncbi:MAG: class I SAM-dependent methyltransferase [Candidatus Binataceae bacterium]